MAPEAQRWCSTYRLLAVLGAFAGALFQWLSGSYLFLYTFGVVLIDLIGASFGISQTVVFILFLAVFDWLRAPLQAHYDPASAPYDLFGNLSGHVDWYGWGYLIAMGVPVLLTPIAVYLIDRGEKAVARNGTKPARPLKPLAQVMASVERRGPATTQVVGTSRPTDGHVAHLETRSEPLTQVLAAQSPVIGGKRLIAGPPVEGMVAQLYNPAVSQTTTILVTGIPNGENVHQITSGGSLQPTNAVYIGPPDKLAEGQIYYSPV